MSTEVWGWTTKKRKGIHKWHWKFHGGFWGFDQGSLGGGLGEKSDLIKFKRKGEKVESVRMYNTHKELCSSKKFEKWVSNWTEK